MYYEELPAYVYELPCGHAFRSLTLSVPDDDDGLHWFICRSCGTYNGIPDGDLVITRPRRGKKVLGDYQLSVRIDAAINMDRAARFYRAYWDVPIRDVVAATGVCQRLVERVAARLDVYGRRLTDDSAVNVERVRGTDADA